MASARSLWRTTVKGFDMTHASRLFEPFHRLHTLAQFEGTGIGLALTHKISRHGARIWADATPGNGATFFFTLTDPLQRRTRHEPQ